MDPHLQVASDPADQIGGRPLFAALGRHRLVRPDLQQQHLIQHHLPELGRELGDELQAGREELPRVDKVLSEQGEETIFFYFEFPPLGHIANKLGETFSRFILFL